MPALPKLSRPAHGDVSYVLTPATVMRPVAVPELAQITLSQAVRSDNGQEMPAGSKGTVVGIWGAGEAYEIEFASPVGTLATVSIDAIGAVEPPES